MAANANSRLHLLAVTLLVTLGSWLAVKPSPQHPTSKHPRVGDQPRTARPAFLQTAQNTPQARLAKGKLLVAAAELGDPNFAETVVLLTDYNHEKGAMGIILNRATRVRVTELLPRLESLTERTDIIFEGGPVERAEILLLVRAPHEPEDSQPVFGDVYLSNSADLLERLANQRGKEGTPFRVYSGYAGWAPGQLEGEVELGAWHIFPATSAVVFDTRPEDLWPQFIRRTTLRLANAMTPVQQCDRNSVSIFSTLPFPGRPLV